MPDTRSGALPAGRPRPSHFLVKLLCAAALIAVPLLASQVLTVVRDLQSAKDKAYQEVQARASSAAVVVQAQLESAQRILNFISGHEEARSLDGGRCNKLLQGLDSIDAGHAVVSIVDRNGVTVCNTLALTGAQPPTFGNRPWFGAALASDGPLLSTPTVGLLTHRPICVLSVPIRSANGQKIALATMSIELLLLQDLMVADWQEPQGVLALVDAEGSFLVRSPNTSKWVGKTASAPLRALLLQPHDDVARLAEPGDVERVIARVGLPGYGLQIMASIPTADALAAPYSELRRDVALASASVLLAGLLAVYGARALARPLRSLATTARSYANGDNDPPVDDRLAGEFKSVALEMSNMLKARRDSEAQSWHSAQRAIRLSRFYAAVSRTNQAIVRLREPQALYEAICKICMETEQATMVWIGVLEDQQLVPKACAGRAGEYLKACDAELSAGTASSAGPGGRALVSGKVHVANDYMNDDQTVPFRGRAASFGIRAAAYVPFRQAGVVFGILSLYSDELDFFDTELVRLLGEMASDISFALDNFTRAAEHREILAELQRRERQSSGIVESSLDAIVSVDAEQRVRVFNGAAARMFQVSAAEAIGQNLDRFIPSDLRARHRSHLTAFALAGNGPRVMHAGTELAGVRRDGTEFPIEASISKTQEDNGILLTAVLRDITGIREIEQSRMAAAASESANRAKTEFLSRMSHELRTPLNAILGFTQLLREHRSDALGPSDRQQLDLTVQAAQHLRALVDDVLDVSVIESGRLTFRPRDFELLALLDDVLGMSQADAQAADIALEAAYRGQPAVAMDQDPDRLSQVMLNLLSNAIKYNRPHGRIAVRVQTSATGVRIEVEDTGLGMTAVQLDGLFQPFNRLGRESGQIAGSGIGMALARQLMDGLGGTVRVRSELDVGTTVTVELPRAELKPALDSSPGADRPVCALPSAAASPPRGLVLYIEDNPVNVLLVQEVLRAWPDVEFATTEGGLEGIALAAARYPALVLLDMQLPDLPGLEVLKRLKADPTTSGLCVVALSASAMAGDMAAALAAGAVDYWTKPIDVPAFRIAMRTLLVDAVVAHRQAVVEGRP